MAQYGGIPGVIDSLKAAADLSSKQYYYVKVSAANTVNVTTSNTDLGWGILQNRPDTAGDAAEVMCTGISKAKLGGTVTRNAGLMSHTDGTLIAATNNKPIVAVARDAGVADDVIEVLLTPGAYLSSS